MATPISAAAGAVARPPITARTTLDPFRELKWEAIARGWESRREEYSYFVPAADISGEIPDGLVGTFFRNGPGINEVFGQKLNHPIDGDGVICALTFLPVTAAGSGHGDAKKKVHFRSRFVRSEHRIKEEYARIFMFRGQMGTQSTSWIKDTLTTMKDMIAGTVTPLSYRNPSNTNVFYWGGKVLSLYETGLPYAMDPRTLMTLGADDLGGALTHGTMSAHFRYDSVRDRLVVISLKPGLRKGSTLAICEFDRAWNVLQKQVHRIPFLNYAHDFVLCEHFYVFHITPFVKITKETVMEIATGLSSPGSQMRHYPDLPSRMVVIPRAMEQHTQYRSFDADPCHIFHFGTSQEIHSSSVAASARSASSVSSIEFSAVCLPPRFAMFPTEHDAFLSNAATAPAKLCFFRLEFGKEKTPVHQVQLDSSSCEFPSTHPYRHGRGGRWTWMMANARGQGLPFRDIVKVDEHAAKSNAQTASVARESDAKLAAKAAAGSASASAAVAPGSASPLPAVSPTHKVWYSPGIVGEPIFIPRVSGHATSDADEDDGWVVVQCYIPERHQTDFVILDARDPHKGPLATVHLKHHVTYGFHGTFTPSVFFEDSVDGVTVSKAVPTELRARL